MRNNIIVYTNIYDINESIAKYAIDFAKSIEAQVIFCGTVAAEVPHHAIVQPVYGHAGEMPVYSNRITKIEEEVEKDLQKLCDTFLNDWSYISYEVLTDVNYVDALKELIKAKQAKYVLIGKTQEANFWDKWLGTVSTTIAEELNVPTILIPQNQKFQPFKHILHEIELNGMDMTKLKSTIVLSRQLNTKVTAAYFDNAAISEKIFKDRVAFLSRMIRYPSLFFKHYNTDNLNETLNTLIKQSDIDAIALRHHQESLLNRIFNNNHTDKIILDNDVPFVVY